MQRVYTGICSKYCPEGTLTRTRLCLGLTRVPSCHLKRCVVVYASSEWKHVKNKDHKWKICIFCRSRLKVEVKCYKVAIIINSLSLFTFLGGNNSKTKSGAKDFVFLVYLQLIKFAICSSYLICASIIIIIVIIVTNNNNT